MRVIHNDLHRAIHEMSMIVTVYISHRENPDVDALVYCLLDSQSETSMYAVV